MEKIVINVSMAAVLMFIVFAVLTAFGIGKVGTIGMVVSVSVIAIASGVMCIKNYTEAVKEVYGKKEDE